MLTASARLARDLRAQFDQQQLSSGAQTWQSADVLPWEAWLARTWGLFCAARFDAPIVLNALQSQVAWERIIRADLGERQRDVAPLWNTHAASKHAMQARRLCAEWRIPLARCEQSSHYDHRCWVRWAKRFAEVCAKNNWIDSHDIAERLTTLLGERRADALACVQTNPRDASTDAPHIELLGFDQLTPQQRAIIDALKTCGAHVSVHPPPAPRDDDAHVQIRRYANGVEQWRGAARFARDKLTANPDARIAIIAPNLAAEADAIEYALAEQLCPQHLREPRTAEQLPWHLSLGKKLDQHPMAAGALLILAPFGGARLAMRDVERLLRSPLIAGAAAEMHAREQLAAWCRRRLPHQIGFARLCERIQHTPDDDARAAPHCPQLLRAFAKAQPLLDDVKKTKPISEWARRFDQWLKALGWPGDAPLSGDEHQTARAVGEQLHRLASLELTGAPMVAADAFAHLVRQSGERAFQVEAHDAPVQVLGHNAAAGQTFDAVWFGNLTENHWHPPQRPNPFVAVDAQRQAGAPDASPHGARQLAEIAQRRLIASTFDAVLSWPHSEDDAPNARSALLFADGDEQPPFEVDSPARIIYAARDELQTLDDARAPSVARGKAGGASLIEDQSNCPFRAFAVHRLGARAENENQQGLSAAERGSLIHRALELIWQQLGDSKRLCDCTDKQLDVHIADAVAQATERYAIKSGYGEKFAAVQRRWVAETLGEWLAFEKEREQSFEVLAREEDAELLFGDLHLRFRIDRIDRLADGSLAVMDYKTGRVASLSNWVGGRPGDRAPDRPRAPQLPLYALAQKEPVGMLAFAQVKKGRGLFNGIYAAQFNVHGALQAFETFDELREYWRKVLPQLANEFVDGVADVAPLKYACANCNLQTLCRIHEQAGYASVDDADAVDVDVVDAAADGNARG